MHLLIIFQQPRPKLVLHFLFPQPESHAVARGMGLAFLGIDLGVQLQLDMVGRFLGF